ncbi:MAG: hypothetical protein AYK19_10050 [Theionarchaea archaeon DG-70-1]|nr:MAG: hypothetical protein AYK19_10050 [Theionarchaea archaeon DG-70-1]
MKRKILALVVLLVLTGGCISQSEPPEQISSVDPILESLEGLPIEVFFEESYKQLLLRSPQTLTQLGIAESLGVGNDTLDNISDAYIKETQKLEKGILDLLQTYDRDALTKEQQISYDVYEWFLDDLVRGHEFMYHNYPVHHFLSSYHDDLVRLFTEYHTITDKKDAEDYITRLSLVDTQVDQLIEGLKLRKEAGVMPPKYIIEITGIVMSRYLVEGKINPLYEDFEEKVDALDLSAEEKQALLDAALTEIEKTFIPALARVVDYLDYLEPLATDDSGVWKLPRGDEYYIYLLRHETTIELTPEGIHQIGLKEVERIQKEMRELFDELGYPEDTSLTVLIGNAISEGGVYDANLQEGKDQVIKAYEDMLEEIDQRLDAVFDIHPTAKLIVVGDEEFGGGGGYYVSASLDGLRPGAFHTGIDDSLVYKYRMPTTAYHEGIPGHYFQVSIAQEMDMPLFRNDIIFNGYAEGWALYAERLAWELGAYEDDPYGNVGRLHLELLRAVRLVADTGIHYKGWTRGEAQTYTREVLGPRLSEEERYVVIPGQATGYMIGMLKMLELRQKAMDALGDKFDIKEFHKVILCNGSMPLGILEKVVQDYIDSTLQDTAFLNPMVSLPQIA